MRLSSFCLLLGIFFRVFAPRWRGSDTSLVDAFRCPVVFRSTQNFLNALSGFVLGCSVFIGAIRFQRPKFFTGEIWR
jgi:hypothetical protein